MSAWAQGVFLTVIVQIIIKKSHHTTTIQAREKANAGFEIYKKIIFLDVYFHRL
jgi:hypothetical protein